MEELVARVFAARDAAHKEHFRSQSYAQHMALGEFYADVIDAVDVAVEAFQGMFGRIERFPRAEGPGTTSILTYLKDEAEWIETNREMLAGGVNSVANLVDGVSAVYLKAIYKLENLR